MYYPIFGFYKLIKIKYKNKFFVFNFKILYEKKL